MAGTIVRDRFGEDVDNELVSMESGLDGRNNCEDRLDQSRQAYRLNGVRPRWPEQLVQRMMAISEDRVSQWSPA